MELITLALLVSVLVYVLKTQEQRRHMQTLAAVLGRFEIEKLMAGLIDGYLRALGESDPARRDAIWSHLVGMEQKLVSQLNQFAEAFAQVPLEQTRVSTMVVALPYFDRIFPQATFDMREAIRIHAQGIAGVEVFKALSDKERRDRAFMLTAELFLLQHTCHWYCKSRSIASLRLAARHKTTYEQVLSSVSKSTQSAYQRMVKK